jgi:hypothetical protein
MRERERKSRERDSRGQTTIDGQEDNGVWSHQYEKVHNDEEEKKRDGNNKNERRSQYKKNRRLQHETIHGVEPQGSRRSDPLLDGVSLEPPTSRPYDTCSTLQDLLDPSRPARPFKTCSTPFKTCSTPFKTCLTPFKTCSTV